MLGMRVPRVREGSGSMEIERKIFPREGDRRGKGKSECYNLGSWKGREMTDKVWQPGYICRLRSERVNISLLPDP